MKTSDNVTILYQITPSNSVVEVGRGDVDTLLDQAKTEKSGGCDCEGDCEDCDRVFRSVAYAKFINATKCGCHGPGSLITIDDLRGRKKKKNKKGG